MPRISWHNWVNQEKRGEWEKGNQDQTDAMERELWRRKGTHTLESHLINGKINQVGGISRCQEEHSSRPEIWKAEWDPNRSSELLAQSPKTETLGWGLGTETEALEVGPQEQAGVCGVETAWGTRKQCIVGGGSNMLRDGSGKPQQREHGRRSGPTGEKRCQC